MELKSVADIKFYLTTWEEEEAQLFQRLLVVLHAYMKSTSPGKMRREEKRREEKRREEKRREEKEEKRREEKRREEKRREEKRREEKRREEKKLSYLDIF
ncbi:hypothetical protein DUI87_12904 [Hirundo rustica rustica]|uniref:Uncharacterized protein n=1 Tax=Hirundo rustica rustica TaxID=333673 RepID=A0A3M0KA87_HIRRU|nr:hypothetical protein DUI87_12904 [Hirundo rustica rustica]